MGLSKKQWEAWQDRERYHQHIRLQKQFYNLIQTQTTSHNLWDNDDSDDNKGQDFFETVAREQEKLGE